MPDSASEFCSEAGEGYFPVCRTRSPEMTSLLSLSHVSKTFENGTEAFGPIDFELREGEFVSLLGPSGCGKSTALRMIAGLLMPSAGEVSFPQTRPEIAFVFQEPTLMPWATTLANARLPLELKGMNRAQADRRAHEALARVGLSGFEKAYPRELSGGMKMRVSIARALAAEPKLLLMDEPFAALDEPTRQSLNDDLLKLWREDGLSVIFVTHSIFESTFLSTRVVVMTPRPGRIAADIALDFPPDRGEDFRLTPQFSEAAARVSAALRSAHA
jgi:NitT/TauT family transport system ATP-binding protein